MVLHSLLGQVFFVHLLVNFILDRFRVRTIWLKLFRSHSYNFNDGYFSHLHIIFQVAVGSKRTFQGKEFVLVDIRELVVVPSRYTVVLFDHILRMPHDAFLEVSAEGIFRVDLEYLRKLGDDILSECVIHV